MLGRAASLAVALLAVLTLVAGGASHELMHADERGGPAVHAVAQTALSTKAAAPEKSAEHRPLAAHGCSGHCAAHTADQAPLLALLPVPYEDQAAWRIEASAALSQLPTTGPERPPRA